MPFLLLVMFGGALGAGARYLIGRWTLAMLGTGWPWGTLAVNLLGGFAMGVLAGILSRTGDSEPARLLLGVGVLGGFTTFSAFSLELVTMVERGEAGSALGYALASMLGAAAALWTGLLMTRGVAA